MLFQERIRDNYSRMTPGFRKLADFIMTNALDTAFLTTTELARRVGVDQATVVRFAQEIGYSGYRELSREIKTYVRDRIKANYEKVATADSESESLQALLDASYQSLQGFFSTELSQLAEAVRLLDNAAHIWIAGEWIGYPLAKFFETALTSVQIPATVFHPSMEETASILDQMKPEDVLFTINLSTSGVDAGYAVKLIREKGLKTITLADSGVILPAREADIALILPSTTGHKAYNFTPATAILTMIWEALIHKHPQQMAEIFTAHREFGAELHGLRVDTPEYDLVFLD